MTDKHLSSEPVESPFANLEPPRKTLTHLFLDELESFWLEEEICVKCLRTKSKIMC